jgi:hypothetical protein
MKMYGDNVGMFFLRFHAFAALIVLAGFLGYLYLGLIVGMVLFLTSLFGLQWKNRLPEKQHQTMIPQILHHAHLPMHRYNLWHTRHHWLAH